MLLRRGSTYYFRQVVPLDLRDALGKTEVKVSLATKDPAEAKRKHKQMMLEVQQAFDNERNKSHFPSHERLAYLKQLQSSGLLDASTADLELETIQKLLEKSQKAMMQGEIRKDNATIRREKEIEEIYFQDNRPIEERKTLVEGMKAANLRLEKKNSIGRHASDIALLQEIIAKFQEIEVTPEMAAKPLQKFAFAAKRGSAATPLLSEMLERWQRERKPSPSADREWKMAVRRFAELHGDLPVSAITKAHIRDFKDALMQVPSRAGKKSEMISLPELVKMGKENKATDEFLNPATVNKTLGAISSILGLAVDNGFIAFNPAQKVRLSISRGIEKRLPYSTEDLNLIFNSPLYVGSASTSRRHIAGDTVTKDAAFWIPLIALFTGARLEEIGQCLVSDIKQESGVYYLDINTADEGKSLKTASSKRRIPLHPVLLRCGLAQYTEKTVKNGEKALFPELHISDDGKKTKSFSQWYNRYALHIGIGDSRKVFHSFRHTFKDACRNADIEEAIHDALTGHSSASVGRTYGTGYNIATLYSAIKRIDYGIDWQHLYDYAAIP